jgi:hypothetical protein
VKILFLDKVKTVFWTRPEVRALIMSKTCYYWILQISSLQSFLAFDDSREFYVCGALPKHQRSDCGAQSPWQKIISRFLQCCESISSLSGLFCFDFALASRLQSFKALPNCVQENFN